MTGPVLTVVTLAERPELVPLVASWLWEAFDRDDGLTPEQSHALVEASVAGAGVPQTFVGLVHGEAAATASLLREDAPERPDHTPWLGGVFVRPDARGRGLASRLVRCVEAAARREAVETLWLYTHSAEALYARLGWRPVETFRRGTRDAVLMTRTFGSAAGAP